MKNKRNNLTFKEGEMREGFAWEIHFDEKCSNYGGSPCRHCKDLPFEPKYRSDGSIYNEDEKEWICPKVIVATNEGGYNSTGLCADCVQEALNGL